MRLNDGLTTTAILDLFTDEVTSRDGKVTDTFDDGRRLFVRSVLPGIEEVRPKDQLKGGVALKANDGEVWLHPYVFRLVCRNGAIMAQTIQTRHLVDLDLHPIEEAETQLREAIQICCAAEAFTDAAGQIRTAQEVEADLVLSMLPVLARLPSRHADRTMPKSWLDSLAKRTSLALA